MTWKYEKKTEKQLNDWYKSKVREGKSDFGSLSDFRYWYDNKKKVCFYCDLSEEESQKIVHLGLLTSKRFPLNGVISQGRNRGYWLEIDKKNPNGNYSESNSELCCYFCNNDKSDVFNDVQYKEFVKDRIGFLRKLLTK